MSFLSNLKKVLHLGNNESKKKKVFNNIKMDCDPEEYWEMVGELGDGAFGKVYKVIFLSSSVLHIYKKNYCYISYAINELYCLLNVSRDVL